MKKTAKIVLMSVLTIAMCVSLIAGATFALFTSDDSVNIAVTSGKVEISASLGDYSLYTNLNGKVTEMKDEAEIHPVDEWTNGGKVAMSGDTITLDRMTPGDGVKFNVNVNNDSNVAIQYRVSLSVVKDDGLLGGLDVTVNGEPLEKDTMIVSSSWTPVKAQAEIAPISVQVELPESAGNEYKDLTCGLLVTVEAVQGNAKPNELIKVDDKHYIANSAGSLIAFADALRNGSISSTEGNGAAHLAITKDIDLAGYSWMPMSGAHIVIDGGNHTISNVNCGATADGKSAFIAGFGVTINDLTLNNVTAKGSQAAAFIANNQGGGALINCSLKGTISIAYQANEAEKYGAVGAFMAVYDGTKTDKLSVEANAEITIISAGMSDSKLAGNATGDQLLLGYYTESAPATQPSVDGSATITVVDVDYSVEGEEKDGIWHVYTAKGLLDVKAYFDKVASDSGLKGMSKNTIVLDADIDLAGIDWMPIGLDAVDPTFRGKFDGQGHTISNLTINQPNSDYVGFFSRVDYATAEIKNVTFDNAAVVGSQYTGVVAGRFGSGTNPKMTNVTIKGHVEVVGSKFVGAVVGHLGAIMEDITVNADNGSFVKGLQIGGLAGATRSTSQEIYGSYANISIKIDLEGRYVGGIVGWEQGKANYTNCSYAGTLTSTTAEPVNTCFGAVLYAGTTVDGFTFTGKIVGGVYTGYYYNYGADATFTNSNATFID